MNQRGFTLLELLIAITLMALVVTISLGAFRLSNSTIEKAENKAEYLERLRSTLSVIDTQVQSLLYVLKTEGTDRINYLSGDYKSLQFVTNTSLWDRDAGYMLVQYEVRQDRNGKYELYVSERPLNQNDGLTALLLKGLDRITFDYQYTTTASEQFVWQSDFKAKTGTPYSIRLTIVDGPDTYRLEMPVRNFRRIEG